MAARREREFAALALGENMGDWFNMLNYGILRTAVALAHAEMFGTIEEVALRTTRLRAVDGIVWHVRNGEIERLGPEPPELVLAQRLAVGRPDSGREVRTDAVKVAVTPGTWRLRLCAGPAKGSLRCALSKRVRTRTRSVTRWRSWRSSSSSGRPAPAPLTESATSRALRGATLT